MRNGRDVAVVLHWYAEPLVHHRTAGTLKIVHVNLARGFRGGERQTALLIEALSSRRNLQQILVCRKDSPLRRTLTDAPGLRFVSANHQLAGHSAVSPADVVHAHEAKAVHWALLHHALKRTPYVVTRRVDAPVKDKRINRASYRRAAARVAISRVIQRQLESRGWGRVALIPSAFAGLSRSTEVTQRFRAEFPGKFLVGHAGAVVDRHKGQRVLLEAARHLAVCAPDMQFVFFGKGEDLAALQAESADLPNVTWLGFKENIGDYLAGLDVFAFPSRNEGLGSVLLDVMDLGIPIIASDAGGIPDIVQHQKTGLLVDNGDAEALAEGLIQLRDEPGLRERLVRGAAECLHDYSAEAMAKAYLSLYQNIINGPRS